MEFVTDPGLEAKLNSVRRAMPQPEGAPDMGAPAGGPPVASGPMTFVDGDLEKKLASVHKQQTAKEKLGNADTGAFGTFASNALNTAFLNAPMAIGAGFDYLKGSASNGFKGETYKQYLDNANAIEDAKSELYPNASMAGTGTGIIGPVLATVATGGMAAPAAAPAIAKVGAKAVAGRAAKAAGIGATMGGASEYIRTNEVAPTLIGATAGGLGGAILSPAMEGVGKVAGKVVDKYRTKAPAQMSGEGSAILADTFGDAVPASVQAHALQKGGGEDAAREAVLKHLGIDGSKGQLTRDFKTQQLENNMLKSGDTFGPKANEVASDFASRQDGQIAAAKMAPTGGTLDQGEAASQILDAVRRAHGESRAAYKKNYDDAFALPGSFDGALFAGIGKRIDDQLVGRPQQAGGPVLVDQWSTPKAYAVMQRLDDPRIWRAQNGEVPLANVDGVRKMFTQAISDSAGNASDRRALQAMLGQFDDHLGQAQSYGLYRGDPAALDLLAQGRAAYAKHAERFGKTGSGDGAGGLIRRMVDERTPISTEDVSRALFGQNRLTSTSTQNNLADRVERITGNMTPWKQAAWGQTVGDIGQYSPQVASKRIGDFLASDIAKKFTTTERAQMRQLQKGLDIVADNIVRGTSSNARPDTSTNLASILGAGRDAMKNGGLGGIVGFGAGGIPGAVMGMGANAALNKGMAALANRAHGKNAEKLFADLPNWTPPATVYRSPKRMGLLGGYLGDEGVDGLR